MALLQHDTWSGQHQTAAEMQVNFASARGEAALDVSLYLSADAVAADWLVLEASPLVSAHNSFGWCKAWMATHTDPVLFVHGAIEGRCAFILPLEVVPGPVGKAARFIAGPFSNINTGLMSQEFVDVATPETMEKVGGAIRSVLQGQVDLVMLANMPPLWRGQRNPFTMLTSIENQNKSFQLPLLDTFEKTLAQINAKRRRKKFRCSVKHLETLGGYEHVVATTQAEAETILATFFRQKAARFQTLGLPNVFQPPAVQAFFSALAKVPAQGGPGLLQLHAVRLRGAHEGEIAAIAGVTRKGCHVICHFGSISETISAAASPGEFLFYLMIEQFNKDGIKLFDFGIGDQTYKRSWCTVETEQRDVLLPITALGKLASFACISVTLAKTAIKAHPQLYSMVQRFRSSSLMAERSPEIDD